MPKFLEEKLQKQYGKDSNIPYKIMNKLGFRRGSKNPKVKGEMDKEKEVQAVKSKAFTSEYLMGSSAKRGADAKPIRTQDKLMSHEHLIRRGEIDKISDTEQRLKSAHKYNHIHAADHERAAKKTKKLLDAHMAGKFLDKFIKNNKG